MNLKAIGLLGAIFIGLLAIACGSDTTVVTTNRDTAGVSVSGQGIVSGEPDVAILTLGVEAEADTVGEARSAAADSMTAMLESLADGGVDETDIQTTNFSVQPQFNFIQGRQELRGFFVSNIATVKIRNIDDTGVLIDSAVQAGGDLARVDGLRFTIDDPSALQDQARKLAMAEAKQKAETLATAAGVSLGSPLSISESGGSFPIAFAEGGALAIADEAARTPITVGELEIQVRVQVVYELEGR